MKLRTALAATTALICLSATASAFAQAAAPDTSATPKNGSASDDSTVVVVTATKRATKLQDTPIAISAFSQAQLSQNHVRDVTDLAAFVPSVAFTRQGDQAAIMVTMRGIGNDSAFTEVADPEVAIYVDGVYSARAQGASVLMYDMNRVEVLRGPQGTLFGRNATVGAINLITAKPDLSGYSASAEVTMGNYARFGVQGVVNMPLSDTFGLRAAFISDRHDGYIDYQPAPNVPGVNPSAFVTSGKKYYAGDQRSARLSALWKPSDRFTWNLAVEGYQDTGSPVLALLQTPRAGTKRWSAQIDTAPEQDRHSIALRSQIDWNFSDNVGLTYITGVSRISGGGDSDADVGATPPTVADPNPQGAFNENRTVWSQYDSTSHEVQLKSLGTQTVDWILGAYYSHEVNAIRFDIDQRNGYRDGTYAWAGSFIQAHREINSSAAFAQGVWHVNDRLRLTAGLRYTQDSKQDVGGRNVTSNCPANTDCSDYPGIFDLAPDATAQQLVAALGQTGQVFAISDNDVKHSWSKMTWLLRADADLWKGTMGYVSVGTGFKGGNIEDGGFTAGPETLTNYEVGTKSTLFGGKATLNLAAYSEDFVGYQVNQVVTLRDASGNTLSTSLRTVNAKGAKAYGFEAEFNARLTPVDHLQITLDAQHTELEDLLTIDNRIYDGADFAHAQQLKGNELPHAPHLAGTIGYDHVFALGSGAAITPRFTTHFEDKSWLSYFNVPTYDEQKAYTKSDLSLKYDEPDRRWSLEAFVLNVEDATIKTNSGTFGPIGAKVWTSVYAPPRTWGVRLRASF
ncbi:MAG TPA: TonB-dependent receptor [Asticcacaulis sp.]